MSQLKDEIKKTEEATSTDFIEVTLGEVAFEDVTQNGPEVGAEFTYIDIGSIDRENKVVISPKVLPRLGAPSRAKQNLKAGDVLVSLTRPNLNAVARLHEDHDGAVGSTGFQILRSKWVHPAILYYLVQSERFVDEMSALVQGALYPAIRPKDISSFKFVLPSSSRQNRIVAKLEELLPDLDAGVAELKAAQTKLGQYRQSLLKAAVNGSLIGMTFGSARTLGELVTDIGQGWSPKCEGEATDDNSVWAVIKTTAIQPLQFDGQHNKVLPALLEPREHLEIKTGDLLVTRAGPRSRVGIACLAKSVRQKLILCDKAYRLRLNEALILPEYAELFLNAPQIVNRIDELKTGISDSGLNLTQDRFLSLAIPLPTLGQQKQILDLIEQMMVEIRSQEVSVEQMLSQSTAQRKNILKAAFSGQLVSQDPNDEPASELLERIRAERAESQSKGVKRGRKAKV